MDNNSQSSNTGIGKVQEAPIIDEMQKSYLDYAMSVIVQRALPDVRDGLKPVQRRIIYAMNQVGYHHSGRFQKCASVTGEVMKNYHPHGNIPIYDALVRMAQDFTMRNPMIDPQGNFGCFTRDTKIRLIDGRELSFEDLIKEQEKGRKHWTFAFNHETQKIEVAEVKKPRLTRKEADLVEVLLDNGQKIRCTPDHRFMLREGTYCEAQKLQPGQSLMPIYTKEDEGLEDKDLKDYELVYQNIKGVWEYTHRLSDEWNLSQGVYKRSAGKIRHHQDFNKHNNNPDNIIRLQWADHWRVHSEMASWRHKNDPDYVKNLAVGRKKFIQENTEVISKRASDRNKKMWQDPEYRKQMSKAAKTRWENKEYKEFMRKASSDNLKNLWKTKEFSELMSQTKSEELKERWQDPNYRKKMQVHMQQISIKLWNDPKHKEHISKIQKKLGQDPKQKERQKEIAERLWKDEDYREKFPKEHFSEMAKSLWAQDGIVKQHREKILKQRQDPAFLRKLQQGRDKYYTRSAVLKYTSNLLQIYPQVTSEIYERERKDDKTPELNKALKYFDGFFDLIEQSKTYNHKVVSVKRLDEKEDVYDITIDSLHNFALAAGVFVHNSIDGDPPAAERYTECRLAAIAEELLKDINKNTVDFIDNYSGTTREPIVLPSSLPNLLLNGASGIAVGMATQIPPHNLGEVTDAIIYMLENPSKKDPKEEVVIEPPIEVGFGQSTEFLKDPNAFRSDASVEDLMKFVKGPDFPTGASIYDITEIQAAYATGKGRIVIRAKADIEETKSGRFDIIVTELPYQVNKALLIAKIADLVKEKKFDGISDLRDESDRRGMRVVVELKRDAKPQSVLNNLYKHTAMQSVFNVNMVALSDGVPHLMTLKRVLEEFVHHRQVVIRRRTEFELSEAKAREHILEGLKIAVDNIDAVITLIRGSKDADDARNNLVAKFKLSLIQAQAILDMQLRRLAALERLKIEEELKAVRELINYLEDLLAHPEKILKVIKEEVKKIREKYADDRRTRVYKSKVGEFSEEDLVADEATIVTVTQGGYVKRQLPGTFRTQARGGKGVSGMTTKEEDAVGHIFYTRTLDNILFFTDRGRVFQIKVWEIPEASRTAKGQAMVNLINVEQGEKITAILTTKTKDQIKYLFMCTRKGSIKKTPIEEYANIRKNGLISIKLDSGDTLGWVVPTKGNEDIIIVSYQGQSIRFSETQVRPTHRDTTGVRGIALGKTDAVVSMNLISNPAGNVLVIMENGLGKKTKLEAWKRQSRGGTGIKAAQVTEKTGKIVTAEVIDEKFDTLVLTSNKGQLIKLNLKDVPSLQRQTQGVILMRMRAGEKIAAATVVSSKEKGDDPTDLNNEVLRTSS